MELIAKMPHLIGSASWKYCSLNICIFVSQGTLGLNMFSSRNNLYGSTKAVRTVERGTGHQLQPYVATADIV